MGFVLLGLIFIIILQLIVLAGQTKKNKEKIIKLEDDMKKLLSRITQLEKNEQ